MKVLYIAGWGRSGSTILDNILGQVEGIVSVGELRYIWDRGMIQNRLCGCGAPFRDCDIWRSVFDKAFGGFDGIDPHRMLALRDRCDRTRNLIFGRRMYSEAFNSYRSALQRLFLAISSVTGAELIVDSSKTPAHGRMLQDIPGLEVYVLHLIRDPRAVAYSWQRKKLMDDGANEFMSRFGPIQTSLMWDAMQLATEKLNRNQDGYARLLYEEFVTQPREILQDLLARLGMSRSKLPFVEERTVVLEAVHGFSGNPSRFKRGTIILRLDDEWQNKMSWTRRTIVDVLTSPLLARYGYRLMEHRGYNRSVQTLSGTPDASRKAATPSRPI
jgi:hypothetical protein